MLLGKERPGVSVTISRRDERLAHGPMEFQHPTAVALLPASPGAARVVMRRVMV